MSPELAKQVLQENNSQLGGTRKIVSILFSDIRSFTKISESMEPHEVVELLNQHFTGGVNAIIEEHGKNLVTIFNQSLCVYLKSSTCTPHILII
jgi:adenylate cyclase